MDLKSISQTKDVFMKCPKELWSKFIGNFSNSIGESAYQLLKFINSRQVESTYKYSGIDFNDFQRALPIILLNYDKINRISQTYDWHYVCENINKCAYLVFLWTLWHYKDRDSKIKQIYINANEGNEDAQNILNIEGVCTWKDWSCVLNTDKESFCSPVHKIFTDIIKRIQYPKKLTDIDKSYAVSVIAKQINGEFTCEQINIIACYAYNNNYIGNLLTYEETANSSCSSQVYRYEDDVCWFNPPKPSGKKIYLNGWFNLNNHQEQ